MRILTVAFAVALLAAVILILPTTGRDSLIAAQSVSPAMPAILG